MPYQRSLDGLRAISVVAVILYHGGFRWIHGGFLGVEVFFVISGYLITALLLDEHATSGRIDLRRFWARRARRLLPALATMLLAVSAWVLVDGDPARVDGLRRDLPWALGYAANWGQIVGDVPYFAPVDPPLLRHLWSLAVEEQWYLVWPLAFLLVARLPRRVRSVALVTLAGLAGALMWWVQRGAPNPIAASGALAWLDGADRVNVNYLSTATRSLGLLLGGAAACAWRPWQTPTERRSGRPDVLAALALGTLTFAFVVARVTSGAMYPWGMAAVSVVSVVLVAVAVDPSARRTRAVLGWAPLVAVGRRSYGLYLWHWPVLVLAGATDGEWTRFAVAMVVAVALAEACYRWIETPIRERRWTWGRPEVRPVALSGLVTVSVAVGAAFVAADPYDPALGGDSVAFELVAPTAAVASAPPSTAPPSTVPASAAAAPTEGATASTTTTTTTTSTTTTTTTTLPPPELPVDVAIVGDSQAHSLAINLPDGIEDVFEVRDGSVDGCSVYDTGRVVSAREGFSNSFDRCRGWHEEWAEAADEADVALVVIGAWDVFDIAAGEITVPFASPAFDGLFTDNLRRGIDAMVASGAHVGLLEVPCMRPQDVRGAGVPALPERGDDARIAHLNGLLHDLADADPDDPVEFVEGPDAWCDDETIAADLDYRWDGVHVYRRGANLIYETIAPELLTIAARAAVG